MMAIRNGSVHLDTRAWQERLADSDPSLHVHLIGIGGAGLSAIAHTLLDMGMNVSGSDLRASVTTERLVERGADVFPDQSARNLQDFSESQRPDVVLFSSAVNDSNQELQAAAQLGLSAVKRDEFLPALLQNRSVIAVAGAHGKSTTTSMIISVLRDADLDPGFIVGADLPGLGNAAAGSSDIFVIEADEYDQMLLGLHPKVAVVTNVEWDHPDCYPTPASFRRAFMQFVDQVDRSGLVVSCLDDEGAEQLRTYGFTRGPEWITYGRNTGADLRAVPRPSQNDDNVADLEWWNAPAGRLHLKAPGIHNILNALAVLAVSSWCGIPMESALKSLASYSGVSRRFEYKGSAGGVLIFDDYAHHPTEISATLAAARQRYPDCRIWAVFQPHTFSRTERMLYRMGDSFGDADQVIVTDIFAARETNEYRVSSAELVAASPHPAIRHIATLDDAARYLSRHAESGDVVITLGAGDVNQIGLTLLSERG
jgi:UDP-N-acetylmuramate--alanine ligase